MFQELFSMLNDGQMLTITLLRRGENLTVGVLPQAPDVRDEAKSQLIPLNLSGTPAELDKGFLAAIHTPVRKVSGILRNMELYEEKADKAASESKALKEKTEKVNKAVKEAEGLEAEKPREALLAYKKVLEQDKYNSKVISKIKTLENKLSEGSLFGHEEITVIVPPETGQPVLNPENSKVEDPGVPADTQTPASAISPAPQTGQIPAEKPLDMFAQAVTAAQPSKEMPGSHVNTAENMAFDPVKYNQFLQFLEMQEAMQLK